VQKAASGLLRIRSVAPINTASFLFHERNDTRLQRLSNGGSDGWLARLLAGRHGSAVTALTPNLLLSGYASGIFPMAESRDSADVFWVEPRLRAIIPLEGFHCSRSLRRKIASGRFDITRDRDFAAVIRRCAEREETWINADIESAMLELHRLGHAHSLEVWSGTNLVGGLYGVKLGRAFFGESMFSLRTDASKVALAWLVARLRVGGFTLLDCQFMTDHLASLGAVNVSRDDYVGLLSSAVARPSLAGRDDERPSEFGALDRLLEDSVDGTGVPPGKVIAQLFTHTS
jgi:leucyl/phenylalanyl-tRNA--protein transferase